MEAKIGSEQSRVQGRLGVVEESLLGSRADGVDGAKSQANQTVDGGVLGEAGGDSRCQLDGLVGDG